MSIKLSLLPPTPNDARKSDSLVVFMIHMDLTDPNHFSIEVDQPESERCTVTISEVEPHKYTIKIEKDSQPTQEAGESVDGQEDAPTVLTAPTAAVIDA